MAQAQVNLVDQRDATVRTHHLGNAAHFVGVDGGARGVGWRSQQHTPRAWPPCGTHLLGIELKALFCRGGQQHCLALGGAHKMAVAGVAGVGHQHFVARIDQGQASQLQGSRCACRYHNALRGNVQPEALRIPAADALTQRGQPGGLGVLRQPGADGPLGGLLHQWRGSEVRFADVQKNHGRGRVRYLSSQLAGGLGHFHDVKRIDALGAAGQSHGAMAGGNGRYPAVSGCIRPDPLRQPAASGPACAARH